MKDYLYWVLAHLSMLLNALIGGRPYESLCGRWYRLSQDKTGHWLPCGAAAVIVTVLDYFDPNHCKNAARTRDYIHEKLHLTRR